MSKERLRRMVEQEDCADIRTIGIPRALLYYRYADLMDDFFGNLGVEVRLSRPTDKEIVARGEILSSDECCLASKAYMGHVDDLIQRGNCDAIFVPGLDNQGHLHSFCTKFRALPDLVANTFSGRARFVTCMVEQNVSNDTPEAVYTELARRFGKGSREAKRIAKSALTAQKKADKARARQFDDALSDIRKRKTDGSSPTSILLVAHPYLALDDYVGGSVSRMAQKAGAQVVLAANADHERCYKESKGFSKTLPWQLNRELIGSILLCRDAVDGVILVSAFPCGPDSMTNDAVMRCISGIPILNLTVDSQSGTAGLETRIESFIDILRYQGKGGYL